MVGLVAAAMSTAEFNRARLAERAGQGWITVTELADTLARSQGVPFTKSHEIATRLVAESSRRSGEPLEQVLADVSSAILGRAIVYPAAELAEILSPQHFVAVRTTPGGPAPSETARACKASLALVASDEQWLSVTVDRLTAADAKLTQVAIAL